MNADNASGNLTEHQAQLNYAREIGDIPVPKGKAIASAERFTAPKDKGHIVFLKSLQSSNRQITVRTILGEEVTGDIKAQDDETISLKIELTADVDPSSTAAIKPYRTRVFFKHQLIDFEPVV